ncbi:universal stress protein [Algoriphagus sediminis]|uniref:Universal stress protein n=1 Tax=Algoriphagus sediminis TaxID=3057113 RepID=A0ABT7YEH9_9BACT|nr:universal stress protein [Algoriphagus sediminis]MDN3204935.1 universal stress protein [Algoriphagus sediminis]
MFKKIALAFAFSPRMEALLAETRSIVETFESELFLIHVGQKTEEAEQKIQVAMNENGLSNLPTKLIWKEGKPVKMILEACRENDVDLLVTGALKKEGFLTYYLGSVARKIIRKSHCSVMTLIDPQTKPSKFSKVVINGTQLTITPMVIERGIKFAQIVHTDQVHILNEIKMYGLQMGTASEDSEEEVANTRRQLVQNEMDYVQKILDQIPHDDLRVNIKVTGGKWAIELAKFCEKIEADLLVVGDGKRLNFFDRIFPHDLEELLSTLPCNLLLIKR